MKRLFIAINPPKEIKYQIDAICEDLKPNFPETRFVSAENLHITLDFLGDQSDETISSILKSIKATALRIKPFDIELEKNIVVPPKKPINKIWLVTNKQTSEKLKEIKDNLDKELINNSVRFDIKNWGFYPHITLARSRGNLLNYEGLRKYEIGTLKFNVQSLDLMQSTLHKSGAEYEVLSKIKFMI